MYNFLLIVIALCGVISMGAITLFFIKLMLNISKEAKQRNNK